MTQDNQHNEMPKDTVEEKSQREEWGAWKAVAEMLDTKHPDEELARCGIYNTSKCYEQIYDFVVEQKATAYNKGVEVGRMEERERVVKLLADLASTKKERGGAWGNIIREADLQMTILNIVSPLPEEVSL